MASAGQESILWPRQEGKASHIMTMCRLCDPLMHALTRSCAETLASGKTSSIEASNGRLHSCRTLSPSQIVSKMVLRATDCFAFLTGILAIDLVALQVPGKRHSNHLRKWRCPSRAQLSTPRRLPNRRRDRQKRTEASRRSGSAGRSCLEKIRAALLVYGKKYLAARLNFAQDYC